MMRRRCSNMQTLWQDYFGQSSSGLRCYDVGRYGVVVLPTVMLMVCEVMRKVSDGTSEHGRWFQGGRQTVNKERLFGVGSFPLLLCLLNLWYCKATDDFGTVSTLVLSWFLKPNFKRFCRCVQYHMIVPNITYSRRHLLQMSWKVQNCNVTVSGVTIFFSSPVHTISLDTVNMHPPLYIDPL